MMTELDLTSLPDLPQSAFLAQVASRLWQNEDVLALWLGGSLARGEGDIYSDIDLRLAVPFIALDRWRQLDYHALFTEPPFLQVFIPFGETAFLHHLLMQNGDIYDLWIQSADRDISAEAILVLGCRNADLQESLKQVTPRAPSSLTPADPAVIEQVLREFWLNSHKHRRVLHRRLHLLSQTGVQVDRGMLLRLWYTEATGNDCGPSQTQTIYGLTHLMRTVELALGDRALRALGAPLTTRPEIFHAIRILRDEATRTGRVLAERLGFPYPHALEQKVREGWDEFCHNQQNTSDLQRF